MPPQLSFPISILAFYSSSKAEETTAALFQSLYFLSSFIFLYYFFISNNSVNISAILFLPLSRLSPRPSQHACVQSALTALASFFADSRAVSSSATQGPVHTKEEKRKPHLRYQRCRVNALHFNIGRSQILFEVFWFFFLRSGFQCCKKHKLLSVCQDLHPKKE